MTRRLGHPVTIRAPEQDEPVVWVIGRLHPNGWDHCVPAEPGQRPGGTARCRCDKDVILQGWSHGVMPWTLASHPAPDCHPGSR